MIGIAERQNQGQTPVPLGVRVGRQWPLLAALALFGTALAAVLIVTLPHTGGHLIYGLDDPYIHMAMAKNIARHGVWGINSDQFSSSSSSLLWTGLLAAVFAAVGVRDVVPFALNLLAATGLLLVAHTILLRCCPARSAAYRFVVLTLLVFATPLPALLAAGQEHALHALLAVTFAFVASGELVRPGSTDRWRRVAFLALAASLTLVRYEGMFEALVVAALFGVQRRFRLACAVVAAAAAPVLAYAIVSTAEGWYWVPNSVLLKAPLRNFSSVSGIAYVAGYSLMKSLWRFPAVLFLLEAMGVLLVRSMIRRSWSVGAAMGVIAVGTTVLHMHFAQLRSPWLYRYEAYVVALGLVAVGVLAAELLADWTTRTRGTAWYRVTVQIAVMALLALSPLTERALRGLTLLPRAMTNIYEQQYQMGRFVSRYYDGASIALNDIGAVNYLANVRCLDLVGLASIDVARLRRARQFHEFSIDNLASARDVRMAIVYDSWFPGNLPGNWIRVGEWTIQKAVIVSSPTVSFYATSPQAALELRANLSEFSATLPPGVSQSIQEGQ